MAEAQGPLDRRGIQGEAAQGLIIEGLSVRLRHRLF